MRKFVETVDKALPPRGEGPSRREEITDSALEMAQRLVHTQYDFLRKVVDSAGKSLTRSDDARSSTRDDQSRPHGWEVWLTGFRDLCDGTEIPKVIEPMPETKTKQRRPAAATEPKTVTLHGRTVTYAEAGSGPVLLLIHGMAGTYENWQAVIEPLARDHTVLAPDLPGHGASAPGGGDYSLGALAAGLRDLLIAQGHDRATLVGHSLGGGIAMQFAYQFPEIAERLVLVS